MATLYILYGSATGNAEGIAKDLAEKPLPAHFSKVQCLALEDFKKPEKEWKVLPSLGEKHGVIIVCSTTGNGDPPENASRFIRALKRIKGASDTYSHVAFSVLGLGDTNYDQFCAMGKLLDKKLGEAGATRAKPLACADEATGLEDVVETWMDTVLVDMEHACLGKPNPNNNINNATTATTADELKTKETTAPITTTVSSEPVNNGDTATTVAPPATTSTTTNPQPEKSKFPLYILYASETGNSEQIAKDLAEQYELMMKNPDIKLFFPSVVCCEMDDFKKKKIIEEWEQQVPEGGTTHGALFVASTTGNGECPENGCRFVRYLKRKQTAESQPLKHLSFAVLGLGDTNYDQFCATGKHLDKRLAEVGGKRAKPLVCADEATGLEDVVDPWTNSIFSDITNACRGGGVNTTTTTTTTSSPAPTPVEEEKKSDVPAAAEPMTTPVDAASLSYGVQMIRSMLTLDAKAPLPAVEHSALPSLGASRSSCDLLGEDGDNNNMPVSLVAANENGITEYTLNAPFESSILAARYLTQTSDEGASKISERVGLDGVNTPEDVIIARELLDAQFPLTGGDAASMERNGKRVIEMTLSLPDDPSTLEYQPGDAIGLVTVNAPEDVAFVLGFLEDRHGIAKTQLVSIDQNHPITVEQAVRERIDLCSHIKSKRTLHSLAQFATDPSDLAALRLLACKLRTGDTLFQKFIVEQRRTFVDVLREFPSCQNISLEGLLSILPMIPPRYYSVCSSPLDQKELGCRSVTVAFAVVDYLTPSLMLNDKEEGLRRRHGVATSQLEAMCSAFLSSATPSTMPTVRIFHKPTDGFRLPENLSTPIVLIGPGTGIAPFKGFLAHRKALAAASTGEDGAVGCVDVYFGCRHADHDWLYQSEMKALQAEGVLTNLFTAFSRDDPEKREYVQDVMKNREKGCSQRLVDIIMKQSGVLYICGDGNRMSRDVQQTLAEVFGAELGGDDSPENAGKTYIDDLKMSGRFLLDIWT